MRRAAILAAVLAAGAVRAFDASPLVQFVTAPTTATAVDTSFTITFLTGTFPTNIILGSAYTGPANPSQALYDAGDGTWTSYSTNRIPASGTYVKFKGDWRTSAGVYYGIFANSLNSAAYTCEFSGAFTNAPSSRNNSYRSMFENASSVIQIRDNPIPILSGSLGIYTYTSICAGMTRLTTLPSGFLDTSEIRQVNGQGPISYALYNCSALTALPENCLNTSNITNALSLFFARYALSGVSSVKHIPENCLNFANMKGTTSADTLSLMCSGMSGVTNAYNFVFSSNLTFTAGNVVSNFLSSFQNMTQWPGQVMWGTNVLVDAIPIPNADTGAFLNCTNMPNYSTINANWK